MNARLRRRVALALLLGGLALQVGSLALAQRGGPGDSPPPGHPPHNGGRPDGRRNGQGRPGNPQDGAAPSAEAASAAALPLAGNLTVDDASEAAFTNPLPGYSDSWLADFEAGDALFELAFVPQGSDPSASGDGLGPLFNATSCGACHVEDGRGRAPVAPNEADSGFLVRTALSQRSSDGHVVADSLYGGQLQDFAIDGVPAEGWIEVRYEEISGTFADGTPYSLRRPIYEAVSLNYGALAVDVTFSPRVANHMVGLGLLEAIPESSILAMADPDDLNGDGISGRPNYVLNVVTRSHDLGRFGWKANQPNLLQQSAGAFNGDMGITSSLFPNESCTGAQAECLALGSGAEPEISDEELRLVALYSGGLSVPAQRNADDPQVQAGERLFMSANCTSCHTSEISVGTHPLAPQIAGQTIRPFTDLLLHDMGEGLADGQPDFMATGSEWRTAPLWGIGLFETVNGHSYYLHDGRARDLMEAVLWHGGEAQASRDAVLNMSAEERAALVAFLKSL